MKKRIIRKAHRYLGLIIGIQFLFWTSSGLYFSWTNLDKIHGDHLKVFDYKPNYHADLYSISALEIPGGVQKIELREIKGTPYYWINDNILFNAQTGKIKEGVTEEEALSVVQNHIKSTLNVQSIELITQVGNHHEYREKPLPAYVISYDNQNKVKAYISKQDGKFQTVRFKGWRWFDFLWMTHTMDYKSRDNFNTFLLRAFSLLGLITVLSGFTLWFVSSPLQNKFKNTPLYTNKTDK